ncbi:MAG: T9SS type A sorting domain-containing protein [Candidatus Latescibacteria bacterium]|nr:T9SS type A sorting domain-containing protein [Candidatus Latescibacterota bacterium]
MTRKALLTLVCSMAMIASVTWHTPVRGATVSGTVRDTEGQAVVGAQVTFTDEADLGRTFSDITDADGRYVVALTEVAVEEKTERQTVPSDFALLQNYPNPFNPSTIIPYWLRESAYVRLVIYNTLGQHICTLVDGVQMAGSHRAQWDGHDDAGMGAGAGVYVVRMEAGNFVQSRKMLMVDGASAGGVRTQGSLRRLLAKSIGSSEEGGTLYTLTITGEDIASFTQTGIAVSEDMILSFVVQLLLTSPENVFANLDYAMNHKDIEVFENLLDNAYWFFSPSQIDTLDFAWDKTEDVKLTGRVFEYFDKVEYELMETGAHWIEYGVNIAPEDATDISAEHPDENWEVFQRPVTLYLLDETETEGFFIQTDFEFKMRIQKDLETGEPIWKIVRWTEYVGSSKIAQSDVWLASWGSIKSTFR